MMDLGLFMMPLHPPEKNRTQCFEEDIEIVVLADKLGFKEAWVGQHNTLAWEPIPSNEVFIANVLPRTQNIRLGAGVSLIPHHHPVNIALRQAFLDHLSRGRINCSFGQSGVPTDWTLYDLPEPRIQGLMTVEGIDLILKLWQSEAPFDFKGKYWNVSVNETNPKLGIGNILKPYQKPHPPIGMSIIKGDSMAARMAGQRGYMPLSTNLVPAVTVKQHWDTYCTGAEEAGKRVPDRSIWRISRSIFVGETNKEALNFAKNSQLTRSFEYLITLLKSAQMLHLMKHDPDVSDQDVTPDYLIKHLCIVGNVNKCIQQLEDLWEITGGFGTLMMIAYDWDDKPKWLNSMELLTKEVLPSLPK